MKQHRVSKRIELVASFFLAVAIAGCGGGGGKNNAGDLSLTSSTPADGASNVATSVAPELVFSEALNGATATSSNVTLSHDQGSASLELNASGARLTATPMRPLLPLTEYTLRISNRIEGAGGQRLANQQLIRFTTADATWKKPVALDNDRGSAFHHNVAVDGQGNVFAVWTENDGATNHLYASRYVPGTGWSAPQTIESTGDNIYGMKIHADANGNAVVVWHQHDGARGSFAANRYVASTGAWGTAQLIETDNNDVSDFETSMDSNGNVFVVWRQWDGFIDNAWVNRYNASAGTWGTAQLLESSARGVGAPDVAAAADGSAIAVWTHFNVYNSIWYSRYNPGTNSWSAPQLVDVANVNDSVSPRISINAGGTAVLAWDQGGAGARDLWATRYIPGTGWEPSALIETVNADNPEEFQTVIDTAGNATVVWFQPDGSGGYNLWFNRYKVGTGWGTNQLIETNAGTMSNPRISVDSRGNAMVVWSQDNFVLFSRYVAGAWSSPEALDDDTVDSRDPELALNANGTGAVVWYEPVGPGRNSIHVSRFD